MERLERLADSGEAEESGERAVSDIVGLKVERDEARAARSQRVGERDAVRIGEPVRCEDESLQHLRFILATHKGNALALVTHDGVIEALTGEKTENCTMEWIP